MALQIADDTSAPRAQRSAPSSSTAQVLWIIAGCVLINWAIQLFPTASGALEWMAPVVVIGGGWGLATVMVGCRPAMLPAGRTSTWLGWLTVLVSIAMFGVWSYIQIRTSPGYGTDELAFDQYAGLLASHGVNPYLHSMAPALRLYGVSPDGFTYTLTGHAVTSLSYPALSFLLYVPFELMGAGLQSAPVVNSGAWALTVLLMYGLLPSRLKPAAVIIGGISVFTNYAVGGVTDLIYLPFLLLAAYRWDTFGKTRLSWLAPVALGLALSVKQTPWLLLPFIVAGLMCDGYARGGIGTAVRRGSRYLAVCLGTSFLVNAVFIIDSPSAWLHGTFGPLFGQLVPAGQGLVGLALYGGVGGGSLTAYTAAAALFALLLFAIYVWRYPALKRATFLLPSLVLFFTSRSFGNYLVTLIPAVLIAAVTVQEHEYSVSPHRNGAARQRFWSVGGMKIGVGHVSVATVATCFMAAVIYALLATSPLTVRIVGVRTTGALATVQDLRVMVTNHTRRAVKPAFTLENDGGNTTFWLIARGPRQLAAMTTAHYMLAAPNLQAQPPINGRLTLVAYTASPATASVSARYQLPEDHLVIAPAAVNGVMALGTPLMLQVHLKGATNGAVPRAHVRVYLSHVAYTQHGVRSRALRINGKLLRYKAALTVTNADGIATFVVRSSDASSQPVFFQASLVDHQDGYPYGYSNTLPVRFGKP